MKNDISPLAKREIRQNVRDFFVSIREVIARIERRDQFSVRMLQNQINTYYLEMKKLNPENNDFVFYQIAHWIERKTGKQRNACIVLTSFFVQNCEVFDADP